MASHTLRWSAQVMSAELTHGSWLSTSIRRSRSRIEAPQRHRIKEGLELEPVRNINRHRDRPWRGAGTRL